MSFKGAKNGKTIRGLGEGWEQNLITQVIKCEIPGIFHNSKAINK